MASGRLFRAANIHLVLAGLLSGAMLFAPIAFASNFSANVHASIYGTWVVLDQDVGAGVDFVTKRYLFQLPLHLPYAILGGFTFCNSNSYFVLMQCSFQISWMYINIFYGL